MFEEYAIAHWQDHVDPSIPESQLLEAKSVEGLAQSFATFFTKRGSDSPPYPSIVSAGQRLQHRRQWELVRRLDSLLQLTPESRSNKIYFDLESQLQRRRLIYEDIVACADSRSEWLRTLAFLNGSRWYKCPRSWCSFFSYGFQEKEQRAEHVFVHRLPFRCLSRGCAFEELGFGTQSDIRRHQQRYHPADQGYAQTAGQQPAFKAAHPSGLESTTDFSVPISDPEALTKANTQQKSQNSLETQMQQNIGQQVNEAETLERQLHVTDGNDEEFVDYFSNLLYDKCALWAKAAVQTCRSEHMHQVLAELLCRYATSLEASAENSLQKQATKIIRVHHDKIAQSFIERCTNEIRQDSQKHTNSQGVEQSHATKSGSSPLEKGDSILTGPLHPHLKPNQHSSKLAALIAKIQEDPLRNKR